MTGAISSFGNPYGNYQWQNKQNKLNQEQQKEQQDAAIKQSYNDVYQHELAHKKAAGSLGGSIVIDTDAKGFATGGHVDIAMPTLNEANPEETIEHAQTVIDAAMAPDDPSDQDYKVAAEAKATMQEAEKCQDDKEKQPGSILNYMA